MGTVVVGMDPHKRSATIEVMAGDETVLGRGRYGTDGPGYRAMVRAVRHWPQRTWAIEGCQGIGRHIAMRLIAEGEHVVDVPAKLSAAQARKLLAGVRPRDAAGKARRRVAAELISDLERIYQRKKAADKELRDLLKITGTTLTSLNGIGPSAVSPQSRSDLLDDSARLGAIRLLVIRRPELGQPQDHGECVAVDLYSSVAVAMVRFWCCCRSSWSAERPGRRGGQARGGDVPRLQRHPAQAATFSDRLRRAWAWAQVRALCPVCCQIRP